MKAAGPCGSFKPAGWWMYALKGLVKPRVCAGFRAGLPASSAHSSTSRTRPIQLREGPSPTLALMRMATTAYRGVVPHAGVRFRPRRSLTLKGVWGSQLLYFRFRVLQLSRFRGSGVSVLSGNTVSVFTVFWFAGFHGSPLLF